MYSIGQFSKLTRVTSKTLRHYEKIGLLSPARVDISNQYRYYSREQIPAVKTILFLKDLGIPLNTIKTIIERGNDAGEISAVLEEHRENLLAEIEVTNSRLVRLARWRKSLEVEKMTDLKNYDVRIRDVQKTLIYSIRKEFSDLQQNLPTVLRGLLAEIEGRGGVCAGAPIMLYYDEEFNPEKVDLEVAWPVSDPELANHELPAVRVASYIHIGPYDGLEEAYQAVFSWINENGYQAVFPIREISLNDPTTTSPEKLATEILVPVLTIEE